MGKIGNLAATSGKQRIILVSTISLLGITLIGTALYIKKQQRAMPAEASAAASVNEAPKGIQNLPGTSNSEQYEKMQMEENKRRAEEAIVRGQSSTSTLVKLEKTNGQANTGHAGQTAAAAPPPPVKTQTSQEEDAALRAQMQSLIAAWSGTTRQDVKQTEGGQKQLPDPATVPVPDQSAAPGAAGGAPVAATAHATPTTPAMAKAGEIHYATLDSEVNTDVGGPVLASIVSGKFKGARLIGGVTRQEGSAVIKFSTMSLPSLGRSISVSAYGVNPDSAGIDLATDVDHHYVQRYGGVMAGAFLSGYGAAASIPKVTQIATAAGILQAQEPLSAKQMLISAAGKTGDVLGASLAASMSRPPTVKVSSGIPIGILFTLDVDSGGLVASATQAVTAEAGQVATDAGRAGNAQSEALLRMFSGGRPSPTAPTIYRTPGYSGY